MTQKLSTPDIEDLGSLLSSIDFNDDEGEQNIHPIERLGKKNMLSVTDFSSQIWCEEQIILKAIHGKAPATIAMLEGTARHEVLELEDHDITEIEIHTREEALAFRLLNSITLIDKLVHSGITRELWVVGNFNTRNRGGIPFGIPDTDHPDEVTIGVRGVIDDIAITSHVESPRLDSMSVLNTSPEEWQRYWHRTNAMTQLGDTKTRRVESEPSGAQKLTSAIQLQAYHLIVNDLRAGRFDWHKIMEVYGVDPNAVISHSDMNPIFNDRPVSVLMMAFMRAFSCLPPLTDSADVIYDCNGKVFAQNSIPCDDKLVLGQIDYLLEFWTGTRTDLDVPAGFDKWKCKWCHYLPQCTKTTLKGEEKELAIAEREKRLEDEKERLQAYLETKETKTPNCPSTPIDEAGGPFRPQTRTGSVESLASPYLATMAISRTPSNNDDANTKSQGTPSGSSFRKKTSRSRISIG